MASSSELVINSTQNGCRIALLRDKSLIEYHNEENANKFTVGDIYLGTVKKVVPGLNAAFIDIRYEKDAFLHYLDLGPQVSSLNKFTKFALTGKHPSYDLGKFRNEPDINKLGKISQVLTKNQKILVQIVKEPISTKGPRLSCELSLAGRNIVLVPFSSTVSISKKVTNSDERKRLLRLISSIKPDNFGVIIRTVAEKKDVAELDRDLKNLVDKWKEGIKALKKANPKDKIIGEMSRVSAILRDVLNESFDSVTVDDKVIYEELRLFTKEIAPDKEKIVKNYTGKAKIFESFGIEKQLKSLFGKSISLPNGSGYLIIEHTEALHVIDVNSGNKSAVESDQESTALKTNLEAAKEVARQLQLRDMGGIIVIDFIDMVRPDNRKKLFNLLRNEMADDRAKHKILPPSKFGLVQITRQRVRPEVNIKTTEVDPGGTGEEVQAPIVLIEKIGDQLERILKGEHKDKNIFLNAHPFIAAYLTKGFPSIRSKWFLEHKKWIKIQPRDAYTYLEYRFTDREGNSLE